MGNKKKVLFVIPSLSKGGAERVISSVSNHLCLNEEIEVNILTFFTTDKDYSVNNKIKVHVLSGGDNEQYKKIGAWERLKLIRKKVNEIKPDIIFPFLDHVFVYVMIALTFSKYKKKVCYAMRANPNFQHGLTQKLTKCYMRSAYKIILQNEGQKGLLSKSKKKKSVIIPNPIDSKYLDYQKNFENEPKYIISVGRLENQKNYELAIKSFANVSKKHPNLKYLIFGQGSLHDSLVKLCKELGVEDKVEFKGFTSDFKEIYGVGDIFLMSSNFEGMPNALAEAIAVGLPVISTNCDFGPSDLILDSKIGILVDGNSEELFTNKLMELVDNYNYYASLSEYRKEVMEKNYSMEKIIKLWMDIIQ